MRRFWLIAISLFVTLSVGIPERVSAETTEPASVSAQAAILMEQSTGRVLYEKDAHTSLRIASITKIMTALLAIESGKMDEWVKVSSNAEGTEGSSLYLRAGEKIKLSDLVYGLMLRSGNDAAVAIAEHVGGSMDGFVYMMNQKAEELGMSNTVFQNPHGLDDHEDHYSSAYDMALLTRYAMNNETYQEISGTKTHRVDNGEQIRVWKNKNRLLTQLYKYSTGGKTGYTKRAKRTLVSTASKDDLDLIVVTLNAPSDWHDHMNLFNWAFHTFGMTELLEEGKVKGLKDEFYAGQVYASHDVVYPLTEEEREKVRKEITLYRPPKDRREPPNLPSPIGKMSFFLDGHVLTETPLYYKGTEPKPKGFWSKFKEIFSLTIGVRSSD
ncbi:D-alanyl-D-alanine carboxypeptidase family protein [Halalkalibacterium halodurans]|uniref:serine-type D-Ala-D-Ala carboxypeptidase n=1 Tax=Halalkalibacterium halodurans TaxID=86665 RepID=A0A0M0KKS0_ALKHA|nr:D-alanyl-D-alanine carboxypeptidase family protein [Halalkalibacterium halodurans]TPE70500.1 D-alanyl-D-alanine carboxypeptidase [Halalkalibacterium halodurans]